jgi:hypothetical protein
MAEPTNAGLNGFITFYKSKKLEVYARNALDAQRKAADLFKVKPTKAYEVTVYICERWNTDTQQHEQVVHSTREF